MRQYSIISLINGTDGYEMKTQIQTTHIRHFTAVFFVMLGAKMNFKYILEMRFVIYEMNVFNAIE